MKICDIVIPILCLFGFFVHTLYNILENMNSNQTTVVKEKRNLTEMPFPLVLQIVVIPAFNRSKIYEYGYSQTFYYYQGKRINTNFKCGFKITINAINY